MPVTDKEGWKKCQENNADPYGGCCVNVARQVMKFLDDEPGDFNASDLINRADDEIQAGGITGFMAGAVASMVSGCHSRGDEFKKSWNAPYDPECEAVVNPAIITIKTN